MILPDNFSTHTDRDTSLFLRDFTTWSPDSLDYLAWFTYYSYRSVDLVYLRS